MKTKTKLKAGVSIALRPILGGRISTDGGGIYSTDGGGIYSTDGGGIYSAGTR